MFKVLVLQTLYTLSDDQTEYQLRDRLSFMRFVGLGLHDPVPDAKTIWLYREQLTQAGAVERLFARFDATLKDKGLLAMGGQILDATVVQARPARLTARRRRSSAVAGRRPAGRRRGRRRSTGMRAGRSSVAASARHPGTGRPVGSRSRSRYRCSATRAMSASTGGTG